MNAMKLYGLRKSNRNSHFKSIGAGKYQTGSTSIKTLTADEANALVRQKQAEKEAYKRKNRLSKVCLIANRLTKQGLSRSAAFKKAWSIVKSEIIATKAAGVSFGNRQKALERLTQYESDNISIELKREADNQFDSNAVQIIATVKGKGSYPVGYVPKTLSATIAALIDYGKQVKALFKEIRGKYQNYHNYGISLDLII
jgi:hypothetical protein